MSDANTSAPAETGDFDLSAIADSIPDDVFDEAEASAAEQPSSEAEPAAEQPTEPEGEEPAEPAEPETPAEPEATEPAPQEPQAVVIDGKAIPLADVEKGFLRQADYTRKTQEVAAERQTLQSERNTLASERQQAKAVLDLATDLVKARLPQEPDPALIDTDVVGYMQQERAYKAAMAELQKIAEARQALHASEAEKSGKARAEVEAKAKQESEATFAEEIRQARAKIPELKSPETAKAFFAKAEAYAAHHGVKPDEVHGLRDHRMLLILSDAMKWRDLQDKKPAAVERAKTAPPIRPAARQAAGTRSAEAVGAARARLEREGSIEAAAALVDDSLFD